MSSCILISTRIHASPPRNCLLFLPPHFLYLLNLPGSLSSHTRVSVMPTSWVIGPESNPLRPLRKTSRGRGSERKRRNKERRKCVEVCMCLCVYAVVVVGVHGSVRLRARGEGGLVERKFFCQGRVLLRFAPSSFNSPKCTFRTLACTCNRASTEERTITCERRVLGVDIQHDGSDSAKIPG